MPPGRKVSSKGKNKMAGKEAPVTDDYISRKRLMAKDITSARSSRASKRLRPPEHQVQCDRLTRQMSRVSHEGCCGTSQDMDAATADSCRTNEIHHDNTQADASADYFDQHEEQTLFDHDVAPMEVAKLASEAGMVLRQHIPVFTKWKEYRRNDSYIEDYMGKLTFELDINNEAVKSACTDMLKVGQWQLRYQLKKLYFDGIPANQQRTGSRSYIAHLHDLLSSEKYKDVMPTAIDLFKECHFSKKKGFSPQVKEVIDEMEAIVAGPVEEGQEQVSPSIALTQVLPTSTFLENICMSSGSKRRRGRVSEYNMELEVELEMEKERSEALKQKIEGEEESLEDLSKQVEEANYYRMKQADEIEHLKKAQEDMDRLIHLLFEKQG
ncbi:hypothetical protein QOZ80_7AG0566440 [Eleusine coracana subsp. coracana]|nr:hypothetical protein QOZ80_7AG0566440 [Eleusine coracana subsp. coracana]